MSVSIIDRKRKIRERVYLKLRGKRMMEIRGGETSVQKEGGEGKGL